MKNSVPGIIKAHYILITILLALYCYSALHYWKLTIDDAYITARYARNAAHGKGLVYNGNERLMGYTNLSLTLIESAIYRIGGDGIFWAKVIGLISGGMVILITIKYFSVIGYQNNNLPGYMAALLLISYPYLAANSVFGLETSLFSFLLLFSLLLFTQSLFSGDWSWKQQAGITIALFLATLTRPEAFGYALSLFVVQVITLVFNLLKKRGENKLRAFAKRITWLIGYIVLLIPVVLILTSYYGSPLPNTFFAKTAAGFEIIKYRYGATYILTWLMDIGGLFLLIPVILLLLIDRTKVKVYGFLLLLFAIQSSFIIFVGGDWMPGYRFIVPLMPIFIILLSMGLYKIWIILNEHLEFLSPLSKYLLASILLAILISYGFFQNVTVSKQISSRAESETTGHDYIGTWLLMNARPSDKIALMDIGRIGFISDLYVIDITGLVNRDIAHIIHNDIGSITATQPAAEKIAGYVLSLYPDYIILMHINNPGDQPFVARTHDLAIWASDVFQTDYLYLFSQPYSDEFLSVYQRIKQ